MFTIEPHSAIDKSFGIYNDKYDIYLNVDYDDVNHERVDFVAAWVLGVLTEHEAELKELLKRFDRIQQAKWQRHKDDYDAV